MSWVTTCWWGGGFGLVQYHHGEDVGLLLVVGAGVGLGKCNTTIERTLGYYLLVRVGLGKCNITIERTAATRHSSNLFLRELREFDRYSDTL